MAKTKVPKNALAKKIIAWTAIILLVLNLTAVSAKWISQLTFWIILIIVAGLSFVVLHFLKKE
jgi:hypothetical protein